MRYHPTLSSTAPAATLPGNNRSRAVSLKSDHQKSHEFTKAVQSLWELDTAASSADEQTVTEQLYRHKVAILERADRPVQHGHF